MLCVREHLSLTTSPPPQPCPSATPLPAHASPQPHPRRAHLLGHFQLACGFQLHARHCRNRLLLWAARRRAWHPQLQSASRRTCAQQAADGPLRLPAVPLQQCHLLLERCQASVASSFMQHQVWHTTMHAAVKGGGVGAWQKGPGSGVCMHISIKA